MLFRSHIDFSFDKLKLGGSAFAQSLGKVGDEVPCVQDAEYFRDAFLAVQELINKGLILAGHDISAGGLITTLLEMCFANVEGGMEINLDKMKEQDLIKILFAENPGITLEEIAEKLHVTEEYLSTQFRKETGRTFTETIRGYRIERVKELLTATNWKLTKIAELAGYTDPKYMSRVFKEETGMLPLEYRKKNG